MWFCFICSYCCFILGSEIFFSFNFFVFLSVHVSYADASGAGNDVYEYVSPKWTSVYHTRLLPCSYDVSVKQFSLCLYNVFVCINRGDLQIVHLFNMLYESRSLFAYFAHCWSVLISVRYLVWYSLFNAYFNAIV